MGRIVPLAAGAALAACLCGTAAAQAITVSPTRIEAGGSRATEMTIRSRGPGAAHIQVRVFAWQEGRPASELRRTNDVVASPPLVRLGARQEMTARIVRTARKPVRGRECYRVLVDQIPARSARSGEVAIRIRHSVPLCFAG